MTPHVVVVNGDDVITGSASAHSLSELEAMLAVVRVRNEHARTSAPVVTTDEAEPR